MSEERILLDLIFKSESGRSLAEAAPGISRDDLADFAARPETRERAVEELERLGFDVIGEPTAFGVSVSAPAGRVREVFGDNDLTVPESLRSYIESVKRPPKGQFLGG